MKLKKKMVFTIYCISINRYGKPYYDRVIKQKTGGLYFEKHQK